MSDPTERLVNLAMYLAAARGPVAREQIRSDVAGYDPDQSQSAFERMFERDKDDLRAMGFAIEADAAGMTWLDPASTFASSLDLDGSEMTLIRTIGLALTDDPGFPFATDLRLALAKLASRVDSPGSVAIARTSDERPAEQGLLAASLDGAATRRKLVEFDYTNSFGDTKHHEVESYGIFTRDGRWYLVGRDTALAEIRVYAVARIANLTVNGARAKSPDFERPEDFNVATYIALPFQYGSDTFEARLRFAPDVAWRVAALCSGSGSLAPSDDGSLLWTITARSRLRLMRWVIENGPGIEIVSPRDCAEELIACASQVALMHDGRETE